MCPWVKPWNPSRASPEPRSPRAGAQPGGKHLFTGLLESVWG